MTAHAAPAPARRDDDGDARLADAAADAGASYGSVTGLRNSSRAVASGRHGLSDSDGDDRQ